MDSTFRHQGLQLNKIGPGRAIIGPHKRRRRMADLEGTITWGQCDLLRKLIQIVEKSRACGVSKGEAEDGDSEIKWSGDSIEITID